MISYRFMPIANFCIAALAINFFDPVTVRQTAAPATTAAIAVRDGRHVLRVNGPADRAEASVSLEPARGQWDLSFYTDIAATFRNLSGSAIKVSLRIENEGATASANVTAKELEGLTYPDNLDVPLLIGEWHFGARDRGQLDCGMRAVENQKERAEAFRAYMRVALADPRSVGAHWFRYHDHPSAGRADGDSRSNSQNGLVDPLDAPYRETIEAAREIGQAMYRLRAGRE